MKLQEMDPVVTYADQLAAGGDDPVVLVNVFTVPPGEVDAFLAVRADDAAFMAGRPGFVDTRLHRGTAGSTSFVNVAHWASAAALRDAFTSPAFQASLARYPAGVVATPHVTTESVRL